MHCTQRARSRLVNAFQPTAVVEALLLRAQPCGAALRQPCLVHVKDEPHGCIVHGIVKTAIGRVSLVVLRIGTEKLAEIRKPRLIYCHAGDGTLLIVHFSIGIHAVT